MAREIDRKKERTRWRARARTHTHTDTHVRTLACKSAGCTHAIYAAHDFAQARDKVFWEVVAEMQSKKRAERRKLEDSLGDKRPKGAAK